YGVISMNLDSTQLLDKHLKEHTANGNMHPSENWYEKDYRDAEDIVWGFTDLNWHSLKKIFEDRSHVWQEACIFILGESGSSGAEKMLTDIFIDGGDKIACHAAVILAGQRISEFSEDDKSKISSRLGELLGEEKYKKFGAHYQISLEQISKQVQKV
ncbi:MAG: hypothetical protein WBC96_13205, partial [Thermodesulfobacteriota bacterium]